MHDGVNTKGVRHMSIHHLIAFNIALIAAILSPGPAFLVAVQTTLRSGRRAGIAVGCGLGLMASIWTAMALLGLDAVFAVFPWAYAAAKICGTVPLISPFSLSNSCCTMSL